MSAYNVATLMKSKMQYFRDHGEPPRMLLVGDNWLHHIVFSTMPTDGQLLDQDEYDRRIRQAKEDGGYMLGVRLQYVPDKSDDYVDFK